MALSDLIRTTQDIALNASTPAQQHGMYSLRQAGAIVLAVIALGMCGSAWSASDMPQARIIVKWKTDAVHSHTQVAATARADLETQTGLAMHRHHSVSDSLDVMMLDHPLPQAEFARALAQLRARPDVAYAVADERRHVEVLPSDRLITATSGRSGQWYLLNAEPASINALAAWDYSMGGSDLNSSVVVAVVDTGVRFDHPDLAGKLLPGRDFVSCDQTTCSGAGQTFLTANDGDGWDADASDPGDWVSSADKQNHADVFDSSCDTSSSSWHGTRVAGIIGAATNNGTGIAGTGWNTRILPIRALGKCGGYDSDIIAGIRWAVGLSVAGLPSNPTPARIINLSLGGTGTCSQAYADLVNTLNSLGVVMVASAGNDSAIVNVPANCSGVVGVVGVRNAGTKVGFSSLGSAATIAAPAGNCGNASGLCLYSLDTTTNLGTLDTALTCPTTGNANAKCYTTPGANDYTDQTNANLGTSFSAPIVSGTIALMMGANSSLTPSQIITALRASAKPFPQTATSTCQLPSNSTPIAVNQAECNCTTSTCGAGLVDAYHAVLAVGSASSSSSSSAASSASSTSAAASSAASSVTVTAAASSSGGGGGAMQWRELLLFALLLIPARLRQLRQ